MRRLFAVVVILLTPSIVSGHPAPFSYLDLRLNANGVNGTLVVHDLDAAYELKIPQTESLLDASVAARYRDALVALLSPRITIAFDGAPVQVQWGAIDVVPERQSVRLAFTIAEPVPGHTAIDAYVFPYDPIHQTFINIYENDELKLQAILDASRRRVEHYAGSAQGHLAVIRTFVLSGIEHIMIGPDHILFLVGLLLLGGTLAKLAVIATAFTIGHSITLSLAALDILAPPAYLIEPLIALTIVIVGADNLLMLRTGALQSPVAPPAPPAPQAPQAPQAPKAPKAPQAPKAPNDIRAWLALGFGLIHGFGFAYVLKEFGLPQAALGWSLFAFNLGVEVGQLVIVAVAAGALMLVRARSERSARIVATLGSVAVIAAGGYWFIERVFLA
jgi:hypothetical protein